MEAITTGVVTGVPFEGHMFVLEAQVMKSVQAMTWLKTTDDGTVQLAREYAKRIDVALRYANEHPEDAKAQEAATKALYLGPHLLNTLRALGGAPGERLDLLGGRRTATAEEEDDLAAFKKRHGRAG